jgi:hypothetical protein
MLRKTLQVEYFDSPLPVWDNTRVLDFLHDDWLRCSALVRLGWTNCEVSKQGWLPVSAFAIEVLAYQIGRRLVCRKENVMGADVHISKKPSPRYHTALP